MELRADAARNRARAASDGPPVSSAGRTRLAMRRNGQLSGWARQSAFPEPFSIFGVPLDHYDEAFDEKLQTRQLRAAVGVPTPA